MSRQRARWTILLAAVGVLASATALVRRVAPSPRADAETTSSAPRIVQRPLERGHRRRRDPAEALAVRAVLDAHRRGATPAQAFRRVADHATALEASGVRGLRYRVDEDGLALSRASAAGIESVTMHTFGVGCGARPASLARPTISNDSPNEARLRYDTAKVDEWYRTGPGGVEQGFDLHEAPASCRDGADGALRIAIRVGGARVGIDEGRRDASLYDEGGRGLYRLRALSVVDATGATLDSRFELDRDGALLVMVDVDDAVYPVRVDPFIVDFQQTLVPNDATIRERFGDTVAVVGDIAFVGSDRDSTRGSDAGCVYVYERVGGAWIQTRKLTAHDGHAGDDFGVSIAFDGTTLVVGADGDDSIGPQAGAAYVFTEDAGVFVERQKLTAPDTVASDGFGGSVDVSADAIIVGVWQDDDAGIDSGSASVFRDVGGTFVFEQKLVAGDASGDDNFGISVAIVDDVAVVGAYHDDIAIEDCGSAYVFERGASSWSESQRLAASDPSFQAHFGNAIDFDGTTVVIGAYVDLQHGSAYVFRRSGPVFVEDAKLVGPGPMPFDQFGYGVALSGTTALIGAYSRDELGSNSGLAYDFALSAGASTLTGTLQSPDGTSDERFGRSVALDADTALIGIPYDAELGQDSGAVSVQERVGGLFTETAELHADDRRSGDAAGTSTAIAGAVAILGAPGDDDRGVDAGAVFVFDPIDPGYTPRTKLLARDGRAGDALGTSVALDADWIVVGAPGDARAGADAGRVYVFRRIRDAFVEVQSFGASDAVAGDRFGAAVALAGDLLVVGAPGDDDAEPDAGSIYVFTRTGTTFAEVVEVHPVAASPGDAFGTALDLDSTLVLVGSPGADAGFVDAGAAYAYAHVGDAIGSETRLLAADASPGSRFGAAVAIGHDFLVVGAPLEDQGASDAGAVYVFDANSPGFPEAQKLVSASPLPLDGFGTSVAAVDTIVSVGIPRGGRSVLGSGETQVFDRTSGTLVLVGAVSPPFPAGGDQFGASVAMSAGKLLVGSPTADDGSPDSGAGQVFAVGGDRGESCTFDASCRSSHCVDQVCCESSCGGGLGCEGCSSARTGALEGECRALAPAVAPLVTCRPAVGECDQPESCVAFVAACPADASRSGQSCGAAATAPCDVPDVCVGATGAGASCERRVAPTSVVCQAGTCSAGSAVAAIACNGADESCPPAPSASPCAPFTCDVAACRTTCVDGSECAAGFVCDASTCVPFVADSGVPSDAGISVDAGDAPDGSGADAAVGAVDAGAPPGGGVTGGSCGCSTAGTRGSPPAYVAALAMLLIAARARSAGSGRRTK